jgi:hypothetical protein
VIDLDALLEGMGLAAHLRVSPTFRVNNNDFGLL